MIEILSDIADQVALKKSAALEEFASYKNDLPVPRDLSRPDEIYEAFTALDGVDHWANAFYKAGYIKAYEEVLTLLERRINMIESGKGVLQDDTDRSRRVEGDAGGDCGESAAGRND